MDLSRSSAAIGGDTRLAHASRMLVLLHAMFRNRYDDDVCRVFLSLDSTDKLSKRQRQITNGMMVRVLAYIWFASSLPFVYAHFVMPMPCELDDVLLHDGGVEKRVQIESVGCTSEAFLRSLWSLILVPIAAVIFVILFEVARDTFAVVMAKKAVYGISFGTTENVKYTSPFFYNLTIGTAWALMGVMAVLTIVLRSSVAAVSGYAMLHMLLKVSEIILAPKSSYVTKCEAKINFWPYTRSLVDGVLARVRAQRSESMISVTVADLQEILNMTELSKFVKFIDDDTAEKFDTSAWPDIEAMLRRHNHKKWRDLQLTSTWHSLCAQSVFIVDFDQEFDVTKSIANEAGSSRARLLQEP